MMDIIKSISTIKNFMGNAGRNTCNEYLYEALQAAVESMEKQIPSKPVTHKKTNRAECPICRATVRGINKPYGNWCAKCGQAIDWN